MRIDDDIYHLALNIFLFFFGMCLFSLEILKVLRVGICSIFLLSQVRIYFFPFQTDIDSHGTLQLALGLVGLKIFIFVIRSMSFKCLLKSIKPISYNYRIFIAYIAISN